MSTRIDPFRKALTLAARCSASLVLVLVGLSGPAGADEERFERHYGHHEFEHHSGHHEFRLDDHSGHQPIPQTCGQHQPSSVPEIDAGAAVCGLALLAGTVMLLRDRARAY